jgi:hypothetical protein
MSLQLGSTVYQVYDPRSISMNRHSNISCRVQRKILNPMDHLIIPADYAVLQNRQNAGCQKTLVRFPCRLKFLSEESRPSLGPTQPHMQWVQEVLPFEVKLPRPQVDTPPSSAQVKISATYLYLLLAKTLWHTHGKFYLYFFIRQYRRTTIFIIFGIRQYRRTTICLLFLGLGSIAALQSVSCFWD